MDVTVSPAPVAPVAAPAASERAQARRETVLVLVRRPAFIIGNLVLIGDETWVAFGDAGDLLLELSVPLDDQLSIGWKGAAEWRPDGDAPVEAVRKDEPG